MIKLLSPDAREQRRLAICLALIAGYVDAYALKAYGVYVSFMSGNTTLTGSMIGQGKLLAALPSAVAILFFVVGSFAGTWLTKSRFRNSRQVPFLVIAAVLAMIIVGTRLGNLALHAEVIIAMLGLAMGLLNSTQLHVGPEPVSLTFVTGSTMTVSLCKTASPIPKTLLWNVCATPRRLPTKPTCRHCVTASHEKLVAAAQTDYATCEMAVPLHEGRGRRVGT